MTRWCHHLKGPCQMECTSRWSACGYDPIPYQWLPADRHPEAKPRGRWDVSQGFYIVLAVMAMLGTWALLAIVWIYMRWPHLWDGS